MKAHPEGFGDFPYEACYNLSTNVNLYLYGEQKYVDIGKGSQRMPYKELPIEDFTHGFLQDLQTNAEAELVVDRAAGSNFFRGQNWQNLVSGKIKPEDITHIPPEVVKDISENRAEVDYTNPFGIYTLEEMLELLTKGIEKYSDVV